MIDFESMSIEGLQSMANGLIAAAALLFLALGSALVVAVRMAKRDKKRHEELVALLTDIRNKLSEPKPAK